MLVSVGQIKLSDVEKYQINNTFQILREDIPQQVY